MGDAGRSANGDPGDLTYDPRESRGVRTLVCLDNCGSTEVRRGDSRMDVEQKSKLSSREEVALNLARLVDAAVDDRVLVLGSLPPH
jgi:hypothetical protein